MVNGDRTQIFFNYILKFLTQHKDKLRLKITIRGVRSVFQNPGSFLLIFTSLKIR